MEDDLLFNGFASDPVDSFIEKYKAEVYNPAVQTNAPTFDDQYSVREALRSGGNSSFNTDSLPLITPEQLEGSIRVADLIAGNKNPLTEEEKTERDALATRFNRLAPVDAGVVGGQRIAGNPYSIDSRGILTGLSKLSTGFINRERANRRSEIAPRLSEIQTKQSEYNDSENIRKQVLSDLIPRQLLEAQKLASQTKLNEQEAAITAERDKKIAAITADQDQKRMDFEQTLANNKAVLEKELLNLRLDAQNPTTGGGVGVPSPSLVSGLARGVKSMADLYSSEAKRMLDLAGSSAALPQEKIDEYIELATQARIKAEKLNMLSSMVYDNVDPAVIKQLQSITGIEFDLGELEPKPKPNPQTIDDINTESGGIRTTGSSSVLDTLKGAQPKPSDSLKNPVNEGGIDSLDVSSIFKIED